MRNASAASKPDRSRAGRAAARGETGTPAGGVTDAEGAPPCPVVPIICIPPPRALSTVPYARPAVPNASAPFGSMRGAEAPGAVEHGGRGSRAHGVGYVRHLNPVVPRRRHAAYAAVHTERPTPCAPFRAPKPFASSDAADAGTGSPTTGLACPADAVRNPAAADGAGRAGGHFPARELCPASLPVPRIQTLCADGRSRAPERGARPHGVPGEPSPRFMAGPCPCKGVKTVPINMPITDHMERDAVTSVLESGVLTSAAREGGPHVQKLERAVRRFTGARHAVAVSSGTAALHAALISMGVGPGDEVVVPSFTFVATANAVAATGAAPVFADVGPRHVVTARSISDVVTPKTRCVMPVHLYGGVADVGEIREAAGGIPILEDAAQSMGSTVHGRHSGTLADAGCYSLYPGKVATAGEGGMVVTDSDDMHDRLLSVRNHGNTGGGFGTFGINMRMPEVCAAVGAVQVGKLPGFLQARRRNARELTGMLQDSGLGLPHATKGEDPNWSLYTVTTPDRDMLLDRMRRNGVGAAVYYDTPIHAMPHYDSGDVLPNTDRAARAVLSLPVHPGVESGDLEMIARLAGGRASR